MGDTNWKRNERDFAEFFSKLLGRNYRRNDAVFRAGDIRRNSDVDILHNKLSIHRGGRRVCNGITGELEFSSSNHALIYRWLKQETNATALKRRGKGRFTVLVINRKYIGFWLKDFMYAYDCFVKGIYTNYQVAQFAHIVHRDTKYEFAGLDGKAEQAARYAKELHLFPVPCIRLKGQPQIAFFRISDIEMLNTMEPCEPKEPDTIDSDIPQEEVSDDSPVEDHRLVFVDNIEREVSDLVNQPYSDELRIEALRRISNAACTFEDLPLPSVDVMEKDGKLVVELGKDVPIAIKTGKRRRKKK